MDINDVIRNLRSCLISCKGGIKLENLRADYRMITGESLPFRQFGYTSIETFIRSIPEITVILKNGEPYVEAVPTKTSQHLTKLVSRQKTRRKIRPQPKKWTPPRYAKGFSSNFRNNSGGFQSARSNNVGSSYSFTTSTSGKSNLYTDFSRPMPLMETIVQCPLQNNMKPNLTPNIPPSSPTKRLKNKVTNPNIAIVNQSVNNCKTIEDTKCKVLNDNTAPSVINEKPKTVGLKPSKLSERLKVISTTLSPLIDNCNDRHISMPIPSIFNIPQVASPLEVPDPRKELEIRTNKLKLPSPIYKMYSTKSKHSAKIIIYASVKVGVHTFHTYPEDAVSEEEAEKIAARLALVNLSKELTPEVMTDDTRLIKERILNIITRHHSGVFMHLLTEYYNEQYGETLPHNWQVILEECPDINQEKGVGDITILCRSASESKQSENNSVPSKNVFENIFPSNEKIQLNPIGPAAPDILPVPEATIWHVYTTYVVNTVEIWVRLGDENNEFVDMINEMTSHYNQIKGSVLPVTCVYGDFYAVFEENYWHRVQCTDFNEETGVATVFFIDEGYEEHYIPDLLHPLDKKFCLLPRQAIRVALQGLKDFRDCGQIVTEIENHLIVDQLFLVKVHSMDSDEYGSYVTVTFYDTSKEDEDIDLNQVLFNKILEDMANSFKMRSGQLIQLYVTHIDESGKIYAQLNSLAKTVLSSENMVQMSTNNVMAMKAINFTKMYLVKWNSQWYRARVTNIPGEQEVTVLLIDVGQIVVIPREDLFHLDINSKALQYIPPQAMQIFLHNVDQSMYKGLVTRFREFVSDTDLLLAKIIRITATGVPVVEIFKRIGPGNMLASINTSLTHGGELSKINEDNNNNKFKKRLDRKSSRAPESIGKLNPPVISDIGQYFDVHVSLAAHPGHFIIQPLNNANELKAMMIDLQNYYEANDNPPLESVGEGKLYAGKYRNDWYRVYVTNIVSDHDVSIYFCDYGDMTIISRSSLQPLLSKFLKLPYQAVKAKLVGIEPMNVDWTAHDCVKFQTLVLEKNFVSVIVESVLDHLSPVNGTGSMLGLRLIDVSTDKDIYIDKLLVEEKRAKYIEGFEGLSL